MIGRAFREAMARLFRRRPVTSLVDRIDPYTATVPLRPIVGESGEFVGWMRKDAA